jgi:hypothetical protein
LLRCLVKKLLREEGKRKYPVQLEFPGSTYKQSVEKEGGKFDSAGWHWISCFLHKKPVDNG